MKYAEFSQYRNTLLAQRSTPPIRMDEFDLYPTMAAFKPTPENTPAPSDLASFSSALAVRKVWQKRMGLASVLPENMVVSRGVKELLRGLFPILKARQYELWIPQDVYAGYRVIAEEKALPYQTYTTLPNGKDSAIGGLVFLSQTGLKSALVMVNPMVPLGRSLDPAEVAQLTQWLSASKDRLLILDTIYEPKTGFDAGTMALLNTGQCVLLHALSKTWISPGIFGAAIAPKGLAQELQRQVAPIDPADFPQIVRCLEQKADLPGKLETLYKQAWSKLTPLIQKVQANWQPPESGYISWLPLPFETLLERFNLLAAPASIFGSPMKNISVISCLNQVVQDQVTFNETMVSSSS